LFTIRSSINPHSSFLMIDLRYFITYDVDG
ncbi:MAG: hypothetical protein ACI90V_012535, partial [Bacillariaceae sp.]